METGVLTYEITITQPALEVDGRLAFDDIIGYDIGLSQPQLTLTEVDVEHVSQTDIITFGRWFKGDKGDKGDPGAALYGTTEYWNSRVGFIPQEGIIVVYSDRYTEVVDGRTILYPGVKIGTGNAYVQDLVFIDQQVAEILVAHMADTTAHITAAERTKWNDKLNVDDNEEVVGETLVLNRL